jgi:dTDP-4-amino-4,6-dideoxygalactose transaminase
MFNTLYKFLNYFLRINFNLAIKIFFLILTKNFSKYPRYVINFENNIAKKFNSKFALTFSSGSAACSASILSLGHRKNSIAFVSKITFPSTIIALLQCNYNIKYLDCDHNFNPIFDENWNHDNIIPDLVVLTHPFGFPIGNYFLEKLISKNKDVRIIFDCSHAQGAKINNKFLNEYADLTFFSMQGAKAISGGEGGVVLTNHEIYYERMIKLSHPGRLNSKIENEFTGVSMSLKLRMHPLAAVIANESLKKLNKYNSSMNKKINTIYRFISKENSIRLPSNKKLILGGFHYGLPFFSEKDFRRNSFLPIKSYNWPFYEKNDFYSLEVFNSDNFIEKETRYLKITKFEKENSDIRSKLFFIDLDWIKYNSENYIRNNIDNFLKSLK